MAENPATYELRDNVVLIRASRLLVVIPIREWVAGIKRGKAYRRHGGLKPGSARMILAGVRSLNQRPNRRMVFRWRRGRKLIVM